MSSSLNKQTLKQKFTLLKRISFVVLTIASLCRCISPAAVEYPAVTQYAIKTKAAKPGFYGINNENLTEVFLDLSSPDMDGGQCYNARDFKKIRAWEKAVEAAARARCGE